MTAIKDTVACPSLRLDSVLTASATIHHRASDGSCHERVVYQPFTTVWVLEYVYKRWSSGL